MTYIIKKYLFSKDIPEIVFPKDKLICGTDYIDKITKQDLPNGNNYIFRGKDPNNGRPFYAFKGYFKSDDYNGSKINFYPNKYYYGKYVSVLFQRYSDNEDKWTWSNSIFLNNFRLGYSSDKQKEEKNFETLINVFNESIKNL